jgi:Transposase IS116/IS110/IS902 family
MGTAPCHLMPSCEEVAHALINVSVNAAECRAARPVTEVVRPADQESVQHVAHFAPRIVVAGHQEIADFLLEPLHTLLGWARARYAGLTGAPDESGSKRREKGLAKAGNARVRCGMIQLAWRFLLFQKDSALAQWYRTRTEGAGKGRKTMIVALARKLLIAFWRLVTTGEVPAGVVLRAA